MYIHVYWKSKIFFQLSLTLTKLSRIGVRSSSKFLCFSRKTWKIAISLQWYDRSLQVCHADTDLKCKAVKIFSFKNPWWQTASLKIEKIAISDDVAEWVSQAQQLSAIFDFKINLLTVDALERLILHHCQILWRLALGISFQRYHIFTIFIVNWPC